MKKGKPTFFTRNWKKILNYVTIFALVGLIVLLRDQIIDTYQSIDRLNLIILSLLIVWQALNYHAYAKMYQHILEMLGHKLEYKTMVRETMELTFVNNVFPSGGVTGISYFGFKMRSHGIPASKGTLIQVIKFMLIFLSMLVLISFALFALAFRDQASGFLILFGSSLVTATIFATSLIAYVVGSKRRINVFMKTLARIINRIVHVVRPHHPETLNLAKVERYFEDLHKDYLLLQNRWTELASPLWWALVVNISEVLKIYTVYMAFGNYVNVGAIILAYVVANLAGLISVLPGGIGIFEALMTGVLVAAGVPAALSIQVTIMYRILSMLMQLPIGYYFYVKTLKARPASG